MAHGPLVFLMLCCNEHCNNCSVYIFKVKDLTFLKLLKTIVIMIIMLLKRVHEGND